MADTEYDSFVKSLRGGNDDDAEYKSFVASLGSFRAPPAPPPVAATPETPVGGFMPAFKSAIGSQVSGVGQLGEDIGVSSGLKRWGEEYAAKNPTAIHSWEDIKESPWLATKEAVGGAAGYMLPALLTRGVSLPLSAARGTGVASSLARGAGAVGKSRLGAAATMMPASYGGIREAQGPEAQDIQDKLLALGGAGAIASIETAFGPQQWALQAMSKEGRTALAKTFGGGSLPKRVGVGALKGAAIEGAEEGVQSPIEQLASYRSPITEESLRETGFSMAMGALGGGALGGGFGALSRPRDLTKKLTPIEEAKQPVAGALPSPGMIPSQTMFVFPDGSTGTGSQVEEYLASLKHLPPEQQVAERAKIYGFALPPEHSSELMSVIGEQLPKEAARPEKSKKLSPIEEARARVDALFPVESVDHADATNILDMATSKTRDKALAAVNKMISDAQKAAQPDVVEDTPQKILVEFESKLPKQQQSIFRVLREAANDPSEWEKYVQPDGTWNATAIAEAAGVGSRKGIPTTIARLGKKLDTAAGQDVKAALAATVAARRVTEPSAYEQLGLSPAQQASVVSPEELFGGEGMEQSMGEISSVGGSQGATSADVSGPMTQQERAVEQEARRIVREGGVPAVESGVPAPTERGLESVREQKVSDIVESIRSGDAQDAVFEWNQLVDRVQGLEAIPSNLADIELTDENIDVMHAVVSAYQDVQQQVSAAVESGKFFDEIGAYEYEFKRIVRERQARIEKVVSGGRKEARTAITEKPEAGGVAAEAGGEPAEPVVGAKGTEGVKVTKRKTRTVAQTTDEWKFPEPAMKRSEGTEQKPSGNTVSTIVENLRKVFFSPVKMDSVVSVVQTEDELPDAKEMQSKKSGTRGAYYTNKGKAWLVADNIPVGQELSVLLHEVGVHMGMKNFLGPENYIKLTNQLKEWYHTGTGKEKELIDLAVERVKEAQRTQVAEGQGKMRDEIATEELLAYFVEEAVIAGIRPTATRGLSREFQRWIKMLWLAVSRAVRKLGIDPSKLTARDVVNLAYGAAHVELQKGSKPRGVTTKYKDRDAFDNAEKFLATTGAYTTTDVVTHDNGTVWATREPAEGPEKLRSMARTVSPESPSAGVWQAVGSAFDKFMSDPLNALKTHGLGWLSLAHLAEVSKNINPEVAAYQSTVQRMQTMEKHWVQKAAKIDVEWGNIKDAVQSKKLSDVMREATREGFDPSDAKAVPENAAQTAIKQKYNQLVPAAKAVYADARDHYAQVRKERQGIMESAIEAAYRNRIETAKAEGDTKTQAKYEKKLADEMARLGTMYNSVKGPYFPLLRLGEWYAVGMSKELASLMDKGEKTAADDKRIAELRKDPKHYRTKSFDRQSQAKAEVKKMEQEFDVARYNVASERNQATSVLSAAGLKDVESYIADTFDAKIAGDIKDMMNELYYMSLPENSVLKREMRREGVHGEEEDMRRVFAVTSLRNAHYLSRMKHADAIKGSLRDAMATGEKNGPDAMEMYNEIAKRAKLTMDETNTPIVDLLTTGSYLAHLGMSPAFILTNATQVPMITIPWLAARSDLSTATSAVTRSYKKTFDIIKSSYSDQGWRAEMDWAGKVTAAEGKMLTELLERNLLNITMEHDLGVVAAGKRYSVGGKDVSIGDALKIGNLPVHITEIANRVTTALAAYNVAVSEKKMTHEAAMEFAAKAVSDTQLDYSALNAPRHMQRVLGSAALAKLTMQFRRYQQGMLWLIAKNVFDGLISKNATPQEKREAKRTLLGLFTTTGIMAGSLGLPMAGTATFIASMIAKAAGAEDEPWDAETEYRNWLTRLMGKDAAEAVAKGLPAWMFNADLSKRVGLSDIASPLPFARQGKTTKETAANTLLAMAGAPVATVVDMVDGALMMHNGDWAKGAEKVIPLKLAQNIIRAGRYEYEGMTKANGEVILPPDKFSAADIGLRGLGISTATESRYYEATKAVESKKAAVKDVRSRLLGKYAQAKIAGEDTSDVMEDIKAFNSRHPERGIRIDASSRVKSVQARRRAARERGESGVSEGKANKPYLSEAEFAT